MNQWFIVVVLVVGLSGCADAGERALRDRLGRAMRADDVSDFADVGRLPDAATVTPPASPNVEPVADVGFDVGSADAGFIEDAPSGPGADGGDGGAGAPPRGRYDAQPSVRWEEAPGARFDCPVPCAGDYLSLAARFPDAVNAVPLDVLHAQLEQQSSDPRRLWVDPSALPELVIEGLAIGWMLDRLAVSTISLRVTERASDAAGDVLDVLIDDPLVGTLEVRLWLPSSCAGADAVPGVVLLHGHDDLDHRAFGARYFAPELQAAGYAVAVPKLRAMACDQVENDTAHRLLADGFTLMGMRVYEALLTQSVLTSAPCVRADSTALLGHSGGSSTAGLALQAGTFRAGVLDLVGDYMNHCGPAGVHCETIPALSPYREQLESLTSPAREMFAYGYPESDALSRILAFLDATLLD